MKILVDKVPEKCSECLLLRNVDDNFKCAITDCFLSRNVVNDKNLNCPLDILRW